MYSSKCKYIINLIILQPEYCQGNFKKMNSILIIKEKNIIITILNTVILPKRKSSRHLDKLQLN